MALREYHPVETTEPKWWELREQLRNRLREAGVPEYRISQTFGKSPEDFQRMNELRIEAGIDPVEGMLDSIPHMLGSADAALAITSLPAFTKTMGQMALPYASMMGESSLGFTDALKGMKDWPEDVPKDWRYGLSAATLPLTAAGGLMGFSRFVPKKGITSKLPESTDIDQTRRNILKGGVAAGGLASLPPAFVAGMKAAPKVATVAPAAGKSFIEMFGTNLAKPNIRDRLESSLEEFVYTSDEAFSPERLAAAVDEGYTIPYYIKNMEKDIKTSDKLLSKFEVGEEASHIKVLIDDDFNVTSTFKDLKKDAQQQAFGQETIHRHLADQVNIIDIEAIGHTGQKHFKNYGLKPDEIHITTEYDFDGFVPKKDFTTNAGTQFEEVHRGTNYRDDVGLEYINELEEYIKQHGRKINKEVDPGIPYEAGDMGFVGIDYYELDGVPIAVGRYTAAEGGDFTDAIIIPNREGMNRLTGMSEDEIALIIQKLGRPKKGQVSMGKEEIANASAKAEKDMERLLGDYEGYTPIKK
jgi:hypothetical protein